MENRGIQCLKFVHNENRKYLIVTLTDGYLLIFNLYTDSYAQFKQLGIDMKSLMKLNRIFKFGELIHSVSELVNNSIYVCTEKHVHSVTFAQSQITSTLIHGIENLQAIIPSGSSSDQLIGLSQDGMTLVIMSHEKQGDLLSEYNNFSKMV